MSSNVRVVGTLLVVVALVGSACSKKSPSPQASIPGGVIGGVPGSPLGSGGTLPSGPPGATANVTTGKASLQVSGTMSGTLDFPRLSEGIYAAPPGGMALNWSDSNSDLFGIAGPSFTGSRPTASGLTLTITLKEPHGFEMFTSSAGECTITIDTAEANRISGSFYCTGLKNKKDTIRATGTFEASG